MADLDPRFTFETFVVGPANRLASAAARRAAENPGASSNPLFIYSNAGLGKTHLLGAIAHRVAKIHPEKKVDYEDLEKFLGKLEEAIGSGEETVRAERYKGVDVLLMDDVQFLTGQTEAQEMFLRTLDTLTREGKQVVLTSDRPPAEINGLDASLRSRFESGLLVDIGPPAYETRVAILRRWAEARGQPLEQGVAEVIGRIRFSNVRKLGGALNRVLAIQQMGGGAVTPEEALTILRREAATDPGQFRAELGEFLREISRRVAAQVEAQEAPWRRLLWATAGEAEAEDFEAERLWRFLAMESPPGDVERVVQEFKGAVRRLKEIKQLLDAMGNPWPEAAWGVLRDPERLDEAEALLASAQERGRAFPAIPEGVELSMLASEIPQLVLRATEQLVKSERPEYNPLYVWSPGGGVARAVLQAAARGNQLEHENSLTALVSVRAFADELIQALSTGVVGAWRERWWLVDLLLFHGAQDLSQTERAQDEFFQLFEALQRRGARIMVAADRPPSEISNIDDRLRSRFEGGLVLKIPVREAHLPPALRELLIPSDRVPPSWEKASAADPPRGLHRTRVQETDVSALDRQWISSFQPRLEAVRSKRRQVLRKGDPVSESPVAVATRHGEPPGEGEPWLPSREVVVWEWPRLEDRIIEDPD